MRRCGTSEKTKVPIHVGLIAIAKRGGQVDEPTERPALHTCYGRLSPQDPHEELWLAFTEPTDAY